jgi:hypothetical protein
MLELAQDQPLRLRLAKNGLEYAQRNSWDVKQQDYLRLVDSMVQNKILMQQAESSGSEVQRSLP